MSRRQESDLVLALEIASPKLLGYLIRLVDHREDAADVLADVLLAAWRRRKSLPDDPDQLSAWLFTAARHGVQNQRRASRRTARLAERLRFELADEAQAELDPAHRAGEIDEVERALAELPAETAELVRLVHWDGLTIAAAAAVIGITPSTARSRYQTARAKLRRHFASGVVPSSVSRMSGTDGSL